MKKGDEKMIIQNYISWRNDAMTGRDNSTESEEIKEQRWPKGKDKLRRWGCYVTAVTNAYSDFKKIDCNLGDYNDLIKINRGYKYLVEREKCPIGQESYATAEGIKKVFRIKEIINNAIGDPVKDRDNVRYIAHVPYSIENEVYNGHWNYVVKFDENGQPVHFDSYTGTLRTDWKGDNDFNYYLTMLIFE